MLNTTAAPRLLSTAPVDPQVIITIIVAPERPRSLSSGESHGEFVTITSCVQRASTLEIYQAGRERWEDALLRCCHVRVSPIRLEQLICSALSSELPDNCG